MLTSNRKNQKNQKNQKNVRTSKKDFVHKFWSSLHARSQPIISSKDINFDSATNFITEQNVISLAAMFWNILDCFANHKAINIQELKKKGCDQSKGRLILSSFVLYRFPHFVLDANVSEMDLLCKSVYNAAKNVFVLVFEKPPIANIANKNELTRFKCEETVQAIKDFESALAAWRAKDIKKLLASVITIYEQWLRSIKMIQKSSMNEAQRIAVIQQMMQNLMNAKKKIYKLMDDEKSANELIKKIDTKIAAEPDIESAPMTLQNKNKKKVVEQKMNVNHEKIEEKKENPKQSIEQQLAAKGVPFKIRTGKNLVKDVPKKYNKNDEFKKNENEDGKYIENVNGKKVLNLDTIIMEEASKKYWHDFGEQIKKKNFGRLFELLTELLDRLKKLSPKKDWKNLDDFMDVKFLQQTIEHGLIDAKAFYGIFYGIWDQIKSLHAAGDDKRWQEWHDYILAKMGASDATWAQLLPEVFNMFFMKLDRIENCVKIVEQIKKDKKEKMEKKEEN